MGAEQANSTLGKMIAGQTFGSAEDADRFMRNLLEANGGKLPMFSPETPLEAAQQVCYDAWEETSASKAASLARKALKISGDCADAYNILAESESIAGAAALFEKGMAAGERALGPRFFKENKGMFWGLIETRPYMRSREGYARCLWAMGRLDEAMAHYEAILELNPNDNQGNRSALFELYMEKGRVEDAAKLLGRYPDDALVESSWGAVLVAFVRGEVATAKRLLRTARKYHPHVPDYLLGTRRVPSGLPDLVAWGSRQEAASYARNSGALWQRHPEALEWLNVEVGAKGHARVGKRDP
ncbi:MAG: tetratricopeptide repeat protein [Euryarchaeota archaeon]|nr:tetratricopeptide repeat protein [Euryarchaeota archaeon]